MRLFWCNYITQLIFYHYALLRNDKLSQTSKSLTSKLEISRTSDWISNFLGYFLIWIPLPTIFAFVGIFSSRVGRFRNSMDGRPYYLKSWESKKSSHFVFDWDFDFGSNSWIPFFSSTFNRPAAASALESGKFSESSYYFPTPRHGFYRLNPASRYNYGGRSLLP